MEGVVNGFKDLIDTVDKLIADNSQRQTDIEDLKNKLCRDINALKEINEKQGETDRKLKQSKKKHSKEIQELREVNSTHLDYICELRTEYEAVKSQLEESKKARDLQHDEVDLLRKHVMSLREKMEEMQAREADKVEVGNPIAFAKKVNRLDLDCTQLKGTVEDLREEMTVRIKSVEEKISRTDRLQKSLNVMHLSLQSRKELGEEVQKLKTDVDTMTRSTQQGADWTLQHPSKTAVSRNEEKQKQDFIETFKFKVVLEDTLTISYNKCVYVDGYTKVELPCISMDPKSGIFTVPTEGEYEFKGHIKRTRGIPNVYICSDSDSYRKKAYEWLDRRLEVDYTVVKMCKGGEKLWLEVSGNYQEYASVLVQLYFSAKMLS